VQALQRRFHALFPLPAVQRFDLVLQRVQVTVLVLRIPIDQSAHVGQACTHHIEHGRMVVQCRFLFHIGPAHALLALYLAVVGFLPACQHLEQRRLARPVASHQPDAFPALDRQPHPVQQRNMPICKAHFIQ